MYACNIINSDHMQKLQIFLTQCSQKYLEFHKGFDLDLLCISYS